MEIAMAATLSRLVAVVSLLLAPGVVVSAKPTAGPVPQSISHDVLVPGTDFHATGTIPCAMAKDRPMGSCDFGVIRKGGGNGTVRVTKPDGRTRNLFFAQGRPIGADVSRTDPGAFRAEQKDDLHMIHIGDERYQVPDAVINGG